MHALARDELGAERARLVENRRTRIALWAPKVDADVYQLISADELTSIVRANYRRFEEAESSSRAKLRRLSKHSAYAGKLFDPLDATVELTHCVQWKHPRHASYFVRTHGGVAGAPATGGAPLDAVAQQRPGSKGAPMSAVHLLSQLALKERVNAGARITFLLKCERGVHLVPVFQTAVGDRAETEVRVHGEGGAERRLDVAVYRGDRVRFNVEILYASRVGAGRRDGSWVEVCAAHVLDQLELDESRARIVCEPRRDIRVSCHYLDTASTYRCEHCARSTAHARIASGVRGWLARHRRRRSVRERVVALWRERVRARRAAATRLAERFCEELLARHRRRVAHACLERTRREEKRKHADRVSGVGSKAKIRRGLTEYQLQRQQQGARLFFGRVHPLVVED